MMGRSLSMVSELVLRVCFHICSQEWRLRGRSRLRLLFLPGSHGENGVQNAGSLTTSNRAGGYSAKGLEA